MIKEIKQLSDVEINRFLHESCGLCWHECEPTIRCLKKCKKCKKVLGNSYQTGFDRNPNYCHSLDLVAIVEKFVIEKEIKYAFFLKKILEAYFTEQKMLHGVFSLETIATATARHRAEACLMALRQ